MNPKYLNWNGLNLGLMHRRLAKKEIKSGGRVEYGKPDTSLVGRGKWLNKTSSAR
jgi:hypothetical protein